MDEHIFSLDRPRDPGDVLRDVGKIKDLRNLLEASRKRLKKLEKRPYADPEEITHISGKGGCVQIAPEGIKVRNIAFDVTPYKYVTAIITEKGVFRPKDIKQLMKAHANLETLRLKP